MPPIDTTESHAAIKRRAKPRVKKSHPLPKSFHTDTTSPSPKARPKAGPPAPKPKKFTLPKTFRTEGNVSGGHKRTQHEDQAIEQNLQRVRKDHARKTNPKTVQAEAQKKFGIKGQQRKINEVKRDFGKLYMSDPKTYERRIEEAKPLSQKRKESVTVGEQLGKGAEKVKEAQTWLHEHTSTTGQRHMEKMGLAPDTSKLGKEAADIVATTPASIYMTADAGLKAAKGNTKPAKKLWKDFKDTSAIAPLVEGNIKEATKRANDRPLSTALEFSGSKALLGRSAGAVSRAGLLGRKAKRAASTERAPLRLYPGSRPGEGPAVGRRYSKDLINNRLQKASDKRKVRKGIDPNVTTERTVPNLSGGRAPLKPPVGPGKHPLNDRVDRHVHAHHVVKGQSIRAAERKAHKRGKADAKLPPKTAKPPEPHELAKEHTRKNLRTRLAHLDAEHIAKQAHDVLGINKPVEVVRMSTQRATELEAKMGSKPRGYASDKGTHYKIEINLDHPANQGPKGASNVAHYELGRVQGMDRGLDGPGEVGSHNRKAYFDNAQTKHAQNVLRQHIGTDLRQPPTELPKLPEQAHKPDPGATGGDQARQRAAQAVQQTHLRRVIKDFAIMPRGGKHVGTHKEALIAAERESKRLGEPMVPINMERLTRMPREAIVSRSADPHGLQLATSYERAWKQAYENHSNGKWVLMPERVVGRFIKHAEGSRNYGTLQRTTNQFKDVVLTTGNPVRWLGGNITDLGMRSAMEGLTPADLYRGARVSRELTRHGRQGELVKASTMGGGFGHLARDVTAEMGPAGVGHLAKVWGHYRSAVYGVESAIEALPQMATVGKEMRTGRTGRGSGVDISKGLKGILRATDDQVQHFAKNMVVDQATEIRIARHVEDVIGKWGKLSPEARKALAVAPFAQWLGAATKYVLVTLPVKHPIKTGLIAGISQMTEKERMALGFSRFLPLEQQVQDYQMSVLPQSVGKDKYGPVVKGTDVARALSTGTVNEAMGLNVGGYLFPQFQGALNAANGTSWTGEPLRYQEGKPHAGLQLSVEDRRKVALGMLVETMTPFASLYRRTVMERGRPSMPQSTILTPETRQKFDPKTKTLTEREGSISEGVKKFTGFPIPGLPQPKRVYTKGAVNSMERSRTAIQEVKKWNAKRSEEAKKNKLSEDPEVNAFGDYGQSRPKDPELDALGGKKKVKPRKGSDPEVDAFK